MGRVTMRDPGHPAWPDKGERTEDPTVAERWRWKYMALAQGQIRSRQLGEVAGMSLRDAFDELERYRERQGFAASTIQNDRSAIRSLADVVGWDRQLHDVTVRDVQTAVDKLVDAGYAPTTVQTYRIHLSHLFRWAGVAPNPASGKKGEYDTGVVTPRIPEREIFTWSDVELERIREAADKVDRNRFRHARLMVEAALATGARFRELLALRWTDFDPHSKTVRIERQVNAYHDRLVPPKGRRARTAVVLPSLWDWYDPDATGYVLPSSTVKGRWTHSKYAEEVLQEVLRVAGLAGPGRAFHDFRRTYGRLFLEAGGWMDELQRSLGHKSIRTTERQYGAFQQAVAASFAVDRIYGDGRARRLRVVE